MERTIKKITSKLLLLIVICALSCNLLACADVSPSLSDCVKTYPLNYEKLFYITLSGINENNYNISEIQSKCGYIVFTDGTQKYLVSIVYVSSTKSILKVVGYENSTYPKEVALKLFKYVEENANKTF